MRRTALIIGKGIAGLSCAELLARNGWSVEVRGPVARSAPTLILNEVTRDLLLDIWQASDDLLGGSYELNARNVCWGRDSTVSTVSESSISVQGDQLVRRFLECISQRHKDTVLMEDSSSLSYGHGVMSRESLRAATREFAWVIDASGRAAQVSRVLGGAERRFFGHRCVIGAKVLLSRIYEEHAYWIETVSGGWLLLAPSGNDHALLQAMVPVVPEEPLTTFLGLLTQTRLIKHRVAGTIDQVSVLEASPQISAPLCDPGWIAVGDAAVSLDPLSGDGTGHAVRSAILAAAVIDGIDSGMPCEDCLRHYSLKLRKTFISHLSACLHYYSDGFSSSEWQNEVALMKSSHWGRNRDGSGEEFIYQLRGLSLTPLDSNRGFVQRKS